MARIVVADAAPQRLTRAAQADLVEPLADVAHAPAEAAPGVAQPLLDLTHRGTTARGVDDDRIDLESIEDLDIVTSEPARKLEIARVRMKSTAAPLRRRHDHFETVLGKHAERRPVHVAERLRHDAPGKQRHAAAQLADRGRDLRQTFAIRGRRNARCEFDGTRCATRQ